MALALEDVWAGEDTSSLFLYAHVPFCFQRCSFCNLFTTVRGAPERQERYLQQLARQATRVREVLPDARFVTGAVGGGTPTWLDEGGLDRVFDVLGHTMGAPLGSMPLSVECSPETVTPGKADLLVRRGTTRASLGVQSFVDSEARAMGRTQRGMTVQTALEALRASRVPTLNIDLIYGLAGQTPATWVDSLTAALEWRPEEIFLYPLFVRPLTGLDRRGHDAPDDRLELYRIGRDLLVSCGYEQTSMRMFRAPWAPVVHTPYKCQADGMVGLGPGARSYTRRVHHATRFAVGGGAVLDELDAWLDRDDPTRVDWGFVLDLDERARRYLLQGLLQAEGLDTVAFAEAFGDVRERFPQLGGLVEHGLAEELPGRLRLTAEGLAWSDAIGPWLYSDAVKARMDAWELR
ncbi:MAG: STM4012 family radical SAM protein [Myxococcales bacterium]|nr:STM4012 family radical SAM protein [Myxococcales bacterium]